jgi:hypothetical protein
MKLEVRTAKLLQQAIMRGSQQMPLKVVPRRQRPLDRHTTIGFLRSPDFIGSKSAKAHLEFIYTML